ncbi:hypothetical protein E2C01_036777 [Portunus trituberculatus]|uniref:Uncharacterized protein n=1 Tax=Portunus trituberculatus TaxID=210409 RepID=A0A5B7FD00_PORTR|nr:hypothetical protein [Portunus trituberculatus]
MAFTGQLVREKCTGASTWVPECSAEQNSFISNLAQEEGGNNSVRRGGDAFVAREAAGEVATSTSSRKAMAGHRLEVLAMMLK